MVRLHGEDQHGLQRQTGKFSLNFSRGENCDVIPLKTIVNRKTDFRETFLVVVTMVTETTYQSECWEDYLVKQVILS